MIIKYIPAFIGAVLLFVFDYIARSRDVYELVPLFDIGMHFFGGLVLGTFVYAITGNFKKTLIFALLIAIGWEVYEYFLDIAVFADQAYWPDTIVDIIMDILGILIGYDLSRKFIGHKHGNISASNPNSKM